MYVADQAHRPARRAATRFGSCGQVEIPACSKGCLHTSKIVIVGDMGINVIDDGGWHVVATREAGDDVSGNIQALALQMVHGFINGIRE